MSFPCDALQRVEKMATNFSTPQLRSNQEFKVKNATLASLRPIHSSKVSKPGAKRSTRLCRDATKLASTTDTHRLTSNAWPATQSPYKNDPTFSYPAHPGFQCNTQSYVYWMPSTRYAWTFLFVCTHSIYGIEREIEQWSQQFDSRIASSCTHL